MSVESVKETEPKCQILSIMLPNIKITERFVPSIWKFQRLTSNHDIPPVVRPNHRYESRRRTMDAFETGCWILASTSRADCWLV